jgi:hypothetical protein
MVAKLELYAKEMKERSYQQEIKFMSRRKGYTHMDYRRNLDIMKVLNT